MNNRREKKERNIRKKKEIYNSENEGEITKREKIE